MSAPSPVPYYRPRPRSIFGPLVLITIGVLFLLRSTGLIQREAFNQLFVRYWPVLLILWGVAKLIEYIWAKSRGEAVPRLGAGGIVFLVFFIMIGMAATKTSSWDWDAISNEFDIGPSSWVDFARPHYEFTDNFDQPVKGGSQIKVLCSQGNIHVTASEDNQAHAVLHKMLRGDSQETANRLNESTHPRFTQQGSLWLLDLTGGDFERGRYDLDLQLPKAMALSLSTRRGNLSVEQRTGDVELSTRRGNASVEQVKGNASLHLRNGSVTVRNVEGNVQVEGGVDDGDISDVTGTLDFDAGYNGTIQLAHIGQPLHFKSIRTDLQLAKLDGEISMGNGDLRASSVAGPIMLNTSSNEVHLEDVSGQVTVKNTNRLVEIRAKAPLGNIEVHNIHGGIQLDLPEKANFRLDAQSRSGNIDVNDFSVSVDNNSRGATARGTVGTGGPDIRLTSDGGMIQIRKQ